MIGLLFILACGEDRAGGEMASKEDRRQRREERKTLRDERYRVVIDDLEETKTDMRCIREFLTVQQQVPDEKLDYDLFERDECERIELVR